LKIYKIHKLPIYLKNLQSDIEQLRAVDQSLSYKLDELKRSYSAQDKALNKLQDIIEKVSQHNSELEHMITVASKKMNSHSGINSKSKPEVFFADNHLLDSFYLEFENVFRGTEAEIEKKQSMYLKYFKKSSVDFSKHPVVDLGSGRGEFLKILKEININAYGIDLNESMVSIANKRGLKTINANAIDYLMKQPPASLGAITGFHLIEHIPFDQVVTLISEAFRCLVPGGMLLLETPNPESLYVGAYTFHYDPSHLKPLPPAIIQFAAKYKGFTEADIIRSKPEATKTEIEKATQNKLLREALHRLFGERDYALLAYK
jgi:2-polyprenyl-3-methyl-5-hydroxy-6-metoxy-1,4-benzoquinol methylase